MSACDQAYVDAEMQRLRCVHVRVHVSSSAGSSSMPLAGCAHQQTTPSARTPARASQWRGWVTPDQQSALNEAKALVQRGAGAYLPEPPRLGLVPPAFWAHWRLFPARGPGTGYTADAGAPQVESFMSRGFALQLDAEVARLVASARRQVSSHCHLEVSCAWPQFVCKGVLCSH